MRKWRDDDVPEVLENIPVANRDWMYGHNQNPNAFIFVREGMLCILPSNGGWLGVETKKLLGDIAPFAD